MTYVSHAAPQLLSLKCQIVVLGRTIPGTLVFTSSLLTFTVDDSTEEYSKAAYLVRSDLIPWPLLLHIYTYTSDVMLNCNYKKVINYMLWKLKIILKLHGYLRNVKYFVEMLVKFTASISSHLSTFSECMQWDTPSNSKFFLVFFFFCYGNYLLLLSNVDSCLHSHTLLQGDYCSINGKWSLQDVRAVFSRRYLHQNKALEIFFADRCKLFVSEIQPIIGL